ncbi:MAG: nuclear transport factor 2 family protein [Candidatus Krumholzibacteriia bacterium]
MSDNTAIIRGIYAAFAAGDMPAVLASFDPQIRWDEAEGFPYGGLYTGPDQVLENVFMKLGTEWEGFAALPDEYVAEGGTVVALGRYQGVYKATGKKVSVPMAHVWKLRNGRVTEFRQHTDTAVVRQALE